MPGRHSHPCPLSRPLGISSGLRARTVSATRTEALTGKRAAAPSVLYLRIGWTFSRGLLLQSPLPPPQPPPQSLPVPFSTLLRLLAPTSLLPPFLARRRVPAHPGGDRCTGRWRQALRGPAPGASLGTPGPVGRACGPRGGGAGRGAARGRAGRPAGGSRARPHPHPHPLAQAPARCAFCPASRPVRRLTRRSCPPSSRFFFSPLTV